MLTLSANDPYAGRQPPTNCLEATKNGRWHSLGIEAHHAEIDEVRLPHSVRCRNTVSNGAKNSTALSSALSSRATPSLVGSRRLVACGEPRFQPTAKFDGPLLAASGLTGAASI